MIDAWLVYERDFDGQVWINFAQDHAEIPVFAVCLYFAVVFWLPNVLETYKIKLELRVVIILWNLALAVFSIMGMTRTVPHLFKHFQQGGFEHTVCTDPKDWYVGGPAGLWVGLFIFSKIPELIDTLFLVLRRRPVIFLHWFHHCTVLLYCWHAYHHRIAPGLWFAAMNYSVHSIMYTYYAAMAARLHHLVTPFAFLITTVQIVQMGVGAIVTVTSARRHLAGGSAACAVDSANYKLGLGMYCSYFILFATLFYNKYIDNKCGMPRSGTLATRGSRQQLCGVDLKHGDVTGRFNDGLDGSTPNVKLTNGKKGQ